MNNEFITLISAQLVSTITIVISIIVLFLHLSKKIDNVSKELTDKITGLKAENQKEHAELKEAILQVHHKHEILKTEQTQLKEQLTEIKTEHKSYIKELTNKVFEALPKSAL